jgi:hypothetical protein
MSLASSTGCPAARIAILFYVALFAIARVQIQSIDCIIAAQGGA